MHVPSKVGDLHRQLSHWTIKTPAPLGQAGVFLGYRPKEKGGVSENGK